ncbi:MAG TPA: hypothetical protein VGF58_14610 [Burkholderiales bacterium]|jgi:hypothetical protein
MKAKTLVACALTAAALPLASAFAQNAEPSGPQGTGWYGAYRDAAPAAQAVTPSNPPVVVAPADRNNSARAPQEPRRPARGRGSYDGPSWETNPPAPPA